MIGRTVFLNDDFIPEEKAFVHVQDLSVQRGYGIFDFLRVKNNEPLYLDHHLERFFHSAKEMRLDLKHDHHGLSSIIYGLIERNALPESGIRLTLTGGRSKDGYSIGVPELIITQSPMEMPTEQLYQKGLRLMTYSHQRQLPHVKTIDYLMAIHLQPLIRERGADEVLYQCNEKVSECPRANIFIVINNEVITPADGILKGITRKNILALRIPGVNITTGSVTLRDLREADEVFITSTTKGVLPVSAVDTTSYSTPGRITAKVREYLFADSPSVII